MDDLSLMPIIISGCDSIESKVFDNGQKNNSYLKRKSAMNILLPRCFQTAKRLIAQSLYITKKNRQGPSRVMPILYPTFTSETRTGDTDSSTNNVNENGTAVKTDTGNERTKACRKAEETYRSNQQLLKDATPNKKANLKTAANYTNAEASLIESRLNSNVDSKYLGQLLRESGMDNKTIKEAASA